MPPDTPPDLTLLDLIGVRVIWVDSLGIDARLYLDDQIVLIDSGLSRADVDSIVGQVLGLAAEALVG